MVPRLNMCGHSSIPLIMIILPNPLGVGGSLSERLRGHRDNSISVQSMLDIMEEE